MSEDLTIVKDITSHEQADKLLILALDIGSSILESGGEINRAENTIERIFKAYGAERIDVFAITSMISVSIVFKNGILVSQSRRITDYRNNLKRIEQLNDLSRKICHYDISLDDARNKTDQILSQKTKLSFAVLLGSALAVFAFVIYLNGSWLDGIVSVAVGLFITVLEYKKPPFINLALQTMLSFFIAGTLTLLICQTGLPISCDSVMIGVVFLSIPGIAIGTALKELLLGDIISGALRIIQSLLISVLIALGFAASVLTFGGFLHESEKTLDSVICGNIAIDIPIKLIAALIGTMGFALIFRIDRAKLAAASVCGLISGAIVVLMDYSSIHLVVSNMVAAAVSAIASELFARKFRSPAVIFLTPALIPLVPGGSLYYSMSYLIKGNYPQFMTHIGIVAKVGLGISMGIVIASVFSVIFFGHHIIYHKSNH